MPGLLVPSEIRNTEVCHPTQASFSLPLVLQPDLSSSIVIHLLKSEPLLNPMSFHAPRPVTPNSSAHPALFKFNVPGMTGRCREKPLAS